MTIEPEQITNDGRVVRINGARIESLLFYEGDLIGWLRETNDPYVVQCEFEISPSNKHPQFNDLDKVAGDDEIIIRLFERLVRESQRTKEN